MLGLVLLALVYYIKVRLVRSTKDFVIANRKIGFGFGVAGMISSYICPVSAEHEGHRVLNPDSVRFCPLCGAGLVREAVPLDHGHQSVCSRCRFVFYLNPKLVAGAIPEQDGRLLLTRRSIDPGRGLWTFPGGFVDFDEPVTDAAIRETREETGLEVVLDGLLDVYSYPATPVIIVYRAHVVSGTLTPCHENDRLEWVTPDEIPWDVLAFQSTRAALRDWMARR